MFAVGEFCADRQVVATIDAGANNRHLAIAMWIIYVCTRATRGRLCGSFCLQMGGGCAPPNPPAFKGHRCLHEKTSISSSPCGSFIFAVGKFCADPFVCNWQGAVPPPTPLPFRAIDACKKGQASSRHYHRSWRLALETRNKHLVIAMWIIYVCTRGRLCGSFCLQMEEAAPPQPPRF